MTTVTAAGRGAATASIEARRSWLVAWSALGGLSISFGAPLITIVALKPVGGIKWLCLAKRAYLPTTPGHTPRERRLDAVTTMKAEEVTVMLDLSLQAVGSR